MLPFFHPSWFVANDLLKKEDIENAEIEVVSRDFTIFKISNWLKINVEPNRFIAATSEPPFIRLLDLVVRTFREVLMHTPVYQLGINRTVHFSVGDEETRNKIGIMLAPQDVWGEWAKDISGEKEMHGGMISLEMEQPKPSDRENGRIRAQVKPSHLIKNSSGIFINVNDHYEITEANAQGGSIPIIDILEKQFEVSIKRSEWIIDQIMALKDKV